MKNRMAKVLMAAGMVLALSLSLFGCGSNEAAKSENATIDLAALGKRIVQEGSFEDEMNIMEDAQFQTAYEGVEESLILSKCVYAGTGATSEQVVLLEAKDDSSARRLKEELHNKVQEDIEENEDYLPKEVSKLKSAVLELKGRYVILAVSKDSDKVEEIVNVECG